MIVILIMAIIIFVGGLAIIGKFFRQAEEQKASIDAETEAQIERLLADGSRVAIPINKKAIKVGKSEIFGLGIYNVLDAPATEFVVDVEFVKLVDKDNREDPDPNIKPYIEANWIFSDARTIKIEPNKQQSVPIPVSVEGTMSTGNRPTVKGTYIFNVHVCPIREPPSPFLHSTVDLLCDGVRVSAIHQQEYYDGHIHKIYVEVR